LNKGASIQRTGRRRLGLALACLLLMPALAGATPPQRIVSLVPGLTESICALGACARLVGTDRYSNWPAEVQALPKLGGLDDAQVERIAALRPDLVLAAPSARAVQRLQALGLRVIVLHTRSHQDVHHNLLQLGTELGDTVRAQLVWLHIEQQMAEAAARMPAALRGHSVYFEVESSPYAAGPQSFIGETLARLSLRNIVPAALGPFPKLSPEFVVRADPDLIMVGDSDFSGLAQRPGWAGMRAIRSGRVCVFESAESDVMVRAGPRMAQAARTMADCLRRHLP